MIAGIGIDLVSIARMAGKIKDHSFKEKVFSKVEQEYCDSCTQQAQHYAVRFAAKEAFLKATGKGLAAGHDLKDIEISNDAGGKPIVILRGSFKEMNSKERWSSIHISLSHEGDQAVAIVIIEK